MIPAPYVEFVADGPVNMAKAEADEAAAIYGAMVVRLAMCLLLHGLTLCHLQCLCCAPVLTLVWLW